MGSGCAVFIETVGVLCYAMLVGPRLVVVLCYCGLDRWWSCVIVNSRSMVFKLSLPHLHSFPLSKVDLEVFSLEFLWI